MDDQLVFVTRGAFVKHSGRASAVANAGKATFFRAQEPYRTSHLDVEGDACIVFSFLESELAAAFGRAGAPASSVAVGPAALGVAVRLAAGAEASALTTLEVEEGAIALLARCAPDGLVGVKPCSPDARRIVGEIEAAVSEAPERKWSLCELSELFKRSPAFLTRSFRAVYGVPLHRYVLRLRLASAIARLAEGEENLALLAFDLGFSSHAHLSDAFRAALGMSPSQFRRLPGLDQIAMRRRSDVANRR